MGKLSGGNYPGGNHPGGKCPRTQGQVSGFQNLVKLLNLLSELGSSIFWGTTSQIFGPKWRRFNTIMSRIDVFSLKMSFRTQIVITFCYIKNLCHH